MKLVRDDLENIEEEEVETDAETIKDFLEELDVEPEEVLVARNGTIVSENQELEEGDELKVMDVIAGG